MRSFWAGLALSALTLTACQNAVNDNKTATTTAPSAKPSAAPAAPAEPADGIKRMTLEEARAAVEKGAAVIIDVRDAESYKANHIKGSINIPYADIGNRIKDLPKDKTAVFYCS
jgi:3-mercaptopyruvate sulfurtransferase SseA